MTTQSPNLKLDDTQDYIVNLGTTPVQASVTIQGGHNIVLVGGEVDVPSSQLGTDGIYLKNQSAGSVVHIEGVQLNGAGMSDGIGIEEPNANTTVDLENIRVDQLHGVDDGTWALQHPDLIQTATGPTYLHVDGFTGYTPYSGFFFSPQDPNFPGAHNPTAEIDLRHVDLHPRQDMTANASTMFWQAVPWAMTLSNVWADPGTPAHNPTLWPAAAAWTGVNLGTPPSGSFVPSTLAGDSYQTPGYASAPEIATAPIVSGTPLEGDVLTATTGTWNAGSNLSYSYQWQRCRPTTGCVAIPGATSSSYSLAQADIGDTVTVVVTGTDQQGNQSSAASVPVGTTASLSAPNSLVDPAISGTAADGQALQASYGTWIDPVTLTYAYQWKRCSSGGTCTNIPGATYSTYGLSTADVGDTVTVSITVTDTNGNVQQAAADPVGPIPPPPAPANTVAPSISGTPSEGQALQVSTGTWSSIDKLSYTYQWQRCSSTGNCVNIPGETYSSYRLAAADIGSTDTATVTATDLEAQIGTAAATGVTIAPPPRPANTAAPSISGTPTEGQALKATTGTWNSIDKLSYTYQWQRCNSTGYCANIPGGTYSSYRLAPADVGSKVTATVTATDLEGQTGTAAASSVTVNPSPPPADTVAPWVTGTQTDGQVLEATTGTWSSADTLTYTYQWQRCTSTGACTPIAGATYSSYRLTPADVGDTVSVTVTATDQENQHASAASLKGKLVTPPTAPTNTVSPAVSGTAQSGQALQATTGTWSSPDRMTYTYQWLRCSSTGSCTTITGATYYNYRLTSADVGDTVIATVTATDQENQHRSASSAKFGPVS